MLFLILVIALCEFLVSKCQQPRSWSAAVSACENGAWRRALSLFQSLQACLRPNSFTHSAVLSSCEKGNEWQQASELLNMQKRSTVRVEALHFNSALSACRMGAWAVALALLENLMVGMNSISFNSVLRSLESGRWADGQHLLQRLLAKSMQPSLITGNSLMTLYEKSNQWSCAQDLLAHQLPFYRLLADTVTYNGALSAFEKGSQWHLAPRYPVVSFFPFILGALFKAEYYGVTGKLRHNGNWLAC